jgi:MoxR-like ATPase
MTVWQVRLLKELLLDWSLGHHLLLLGAQGVGKNKLADKLLSLLNAEREYVQLHRDTTVAALTTRTVLERGVIRQEDTPLVRAVRHGRVLLVDEADKAPLEVACVLKALAEGELALGDGRRLVPRLEGESADTAHGEEHCGAEVIAVHPGFRMVVLANPPGWPFHGRGLAPCMCTLCAASSDPTVKRISSDGRMGL